jgi:hypothetical protein
MNVEVKDGSTVMVFADLGDAVSVEMLLPPIPDNTPMPFSSMVAGAVSILFHEDNEEFRRIIGDKLQTVFFPRPNILH